MAEDLLTPLLFQIGGGTLLGFAAGYAAKKILKLVLLLVGLLTGALIFLEYEGIIDVNYDALVSAVERAMGLTQEAAESLRAHIVANIPFASSFLAAFVLGFKYG